MKKIVFTAIVMLLSTTVVKAQKEKKEGNEKIYVQLKEGAKPTIYVNDKLFDFPLELIDQNKIASVFVFKDAEAIKKYNAPNGVILIKTKELEITSIPMPKVAKNDKEIGDKNGPMFIVDGKVTSKKMADTISTYKIGNIKILKGEAALKKYNAPNGVVIITTKK